MAVAAAVFFLTCLCNFPLRELVRENTTQQRQRQQNGTARVRASAHTYERDCKPASCVCVCAGRFASAAMC